jgi:hypothetical protein
MPVVRGCLGEKSEMNARGLHGEQQGRQQQLQSSFKWACGNAFCKAYKFGNDHVCMTDGLDSIWASVLAYELIQQSLHFLWTSKFKDGVDDVFQIGKKAPADQIEIGMKVLRRG